MGLSKIAKKVLTYFMDGPQAVLYKLTLPLFWVLIFLDCLQLQAASKNCIFVVKVRTFWETHKIWKNLPHGFDKSADLLNKRQNHEEDFFQIMCASEKVRTSPIFLIFESSALNLVNKFKMVLYHWIFNQQLFNLFIKIGFVLNNFVCRQ